MLKIIPAPDFEKNMLRCKNKNAATQKYGAGHCVV
jgi:hypothetical protein